MPPLLARSISRSLKKMEFVTFMPVFYPLQLLLVSLFMTSHTYWPESSYAPAFMYFTQRCWSSFRGCGMSSGLRLSRWRWLHRSLGSSWRWWFGSGLVRRCPIKWTWFSCLELACFWFWSRLRSWSCGLAESGLQWVAGGCWFCQQRRLQRWLVWKCSRTFCVFGLTSC